MYLTNKFLCGLVLSKTSPQANKIIFAPAPQNLLLKIYPALNLSPSADSRNEPSSRAAGAKPQQVKYIKAQLALTDKYHMTSSGWKDAVFTLWPWVEMMQCCLTFLVPEED